MAPRVRNFLHASLLLSLGICYMIPQHGEAADSPYYAIELNSALDSQPKQSVTIGLLEAGASEWMDGVPPPEPCGFDYYIASGLAWPWDRLSLHLIPQVPGQVDPLPSYGTDVRAQAGRDAACRCAGQRTRRRRRLVGTGG